MINEKSTLNELFNRAVDTLSEVEPGEVFIVKELFRGFEWKRIPIGNRTKLGAMVFAYANSDEGSLLIEPLDKTEKKQQRYKKL